ncbi:Uncharacterised protein [uncultured Eubacterium sp.]|uniref:hypothetical protein n=1 Tax=Brotomerdimonas butyrica TaxID=2981721 RepID=UPI000820B048|nr:hypothetical protein [Brotomerdimonas butyrica]MCU6756433.1 hypothetical protein [Brotomerdimonas butyrica]SCH83446.1 Uncharacterised protein [uncultured Eubacterium sp.]
MSNKFWERYEKGLDYIQKKRLIDRTNKNWNFYSGKQWDGIESGSEELPFLNFIKPTIKHKVSTVSQNNMVANYSDAEGREELAEFYDKCNTLFSACWERANEDLELWSTMKEAAVTGDGIQYFGTADVGDMQRLPNTSVFYGDESQPNIQLQPYVIIQERLAVGKIKAIAEENGLSKEEIDQIVPDRETEHMVGNRDEVEDSSTSDESKATCIIHLEKKDGIVHVARATKTVVFQPEKAIRVINSDGSDGRGMTLYPLLKISWEDFPNSARGLSEVEQLIPNQLEINKTLARRSMIIKLTAYPRIAYDGTVIANPEDLEKVGAPIEMQSGGVQSVNQAIAYLNPAQSNSDPKNYADDLLSISQELSGSGETAMGNINPNRVAASAIIAIRDQAALPLNEQVAKMKTFVEDMARLWIEIWAVYNPNGLDVLVERIDEKTGEKHKVLEKITKKEIDEMRPDIRVDTSQDNPWTKEAEQNWLDNVLEKGHIQFDEYIEASPEHGIVPKNKMQAILDERKAEQRRQMELEGNMLKQTEGDAMAQATAAWEAQDGNSGQAM